MYTMKKTNLRLMLNIAFIAFCFAADAQNRRNIKQEEANKKLVAVFYQKLFGDLDLSVIDQYINFLNAQMRMICMVLDFADIVKDTWLVYQ